MSNEPFLRLVQYGWPHEYHAELFAEGTREIIIQGPGTETFDQFTNRVERFLTSQGVTVSQRGWKDIGPLCKEIEII